MQIEITSDDNLSTMKISGSFVGSINFAFSRELNRYLSHNFKKLVVDMSNVSQVDSYALGILCSFGNELQDKRVDIEFIALQPFVKDMFELMEMDKIFKVKGSL